MLKFKSTRQETEWLDKRVPAKLRDLVEILADKRWERLGHDTVVTDLYRTPAENAAAEATSQTHVEWRAADLRVDPTQLFAEMELRDWMNKNYPTGAEPKMPRVSPLDHGTALHYHVQVTKAEAKKRR